MKLRSRTEKKKQSLISPDNKNMFLLENIWCKCCRTITGYWFLEVRIHGKHSVLSGSGLIALCFKLSQQCKPSKGICSSEHLFKHFLDFSWNGKITRQGSQVSRMHSSALWLCTKEKQSFELCYYFPNRALPNPASYDVIGSYVCAVIGWYSLHQSLPSGLSAWSSSAPKSLCLFQPGEQEPSVWVRVKVHKDVLFLPKPQQTLISCAINQLNCICLKLWPLSWWGLGT